MGICPDGESLIRSVAYSSVFHRVARSSVPLLPPSSTKEEVKSQIKPIRVRSSVMMQQMEVARQRRQQKLELFETIKQMRAAGMKVSQNREATRTRPVSVAH